MIRRKSVSVTRDERFVSSVRRTGAADFLLAVFAAAPWVEGNGTKWPRQLLLVVEKSGFLNVAAAARPDPAVVHEFLPGGTSIYVRTRNEGNPFGKSVGRAYPFWSERISFARTAHALIRTAAVQRFPVDFVPILGTDTNGRFRSGRNWFVVRRSLNVDLARRPGHGKGRVRVCFIITRT